MSDLGNNAAKMIANKHCQMMAMYDNKNYRASCRDVAINQCKGQVSVEVQRFVAAPLVPTFSAILWASATIKFIP